MEPIIVYRIEHNTLKKGLFQAYIHDEGYLIKKHSQFETIKDRHFGEDFPNPYDDKILSQYNWENKYFAYNSLEMVTKAITKLEFKECYDMGFRLYKLKLSKYKQTPYQTVFMRKWVISKRDISKQFLNS